MYLAGNLQNVAGAVRPEELIARILLHASKEPLDELKPAFHKAIDEVRHSLTEASGRTLSSARKDMYQSVLDRLDPQVQSADRTFDMGHTMLESRARLADRGDVLTAATTRLVEAAVKTQSSDAAAGAAALERAVLLMRMAIWRFEATNDPMGPATFRTNAAAVAEITYRIREAEYS